MSAGHDHPSCDLSALGGPWGAPTPRSSHKAALPARLFGPKAGHCPFSVQEKPSLQRDLSKWDRKSLFWAESWHERALPVNDVRIKYIIILINLPRPMFSAFIICIELKP